MGDITFFDTAAGLIPVLLLGGAITAQLRRDDSRGAKPLSPWRLTATKVTSALPAVSRPPAPILVVTLLFFLPAAAEVFAIASALGDAPTGFAVWLVAFAVTFGTWALAATLTWPWLRQIFEGRIARAVFAVSLLAMVLLSTRLLVTSVDLETLRQRTEVSLRSDPLFNVETLRWIDAQEKEIQARLAAGRITRRQAAQERLSLARGRTFIAKGMLRSSPPARVGP